MNRTDLQMARADAQRGPRPRARLPRHCRSAAAPGEAVHALQRRLRRLGLHSVCEEAHCPNRNDCFSRGTVTFMLLGSVCTRTCRFCSVATGRPAKVDPDEPARIAEAVEQLGLAHAVLTSVNRDDLGDGGASHFARAIAAIRGRTPRVIVEVLTPDFAGRAESIDRVADARPDVYNHNVETVPRLYRQVRPAASYSRSLELLSRVGDRAATKSGLMLGLGERRSEVLDVLRDLREAGVECVTLGQYLRPTLRHLPVDRYVDPAEFEELASLARELGFTSVASGPLVRSSFHADTSFQEVEKSRHVALR
jgi:lipoic acid synthetase